MEIEHAHITIIGAGIAGLSLACLLAEAGAEVTLLEQSEQIRAVGAGIQITPNGVSVLRGLGLEQDLRRTSISAKAIEIYDALSGGMLNQLDLTSPKKSDSIGGYYFVHRADLLAMLEYKARSLGVAISLGQRVIAVDLNKKRPEWQTHTSYGAADLLIGTDGVNSFLRQKLSPAVQPPLFSGQVAWRAVIPNAGGLKTERSSIAQNAEIYLAPKRHLVSYPIGNEGQLRNIVAIEERSGWASKNRYETGDAASLLALFHDFCPRVQQWLEAVEKPLIWGLFLQPVADRWWSSCLGGGTVILGDAAHPTLPFLAQGANLALEDAWALVVMLKRYDDYESALAAFETARKPRCVRAIRVAQNQAKIYHLGGVSRFIAHNGLRMINYVYPNAMIQRYHWLHGYDVRKI